MDGDHKTFSDGLTEGRLRSLEAATNDLWRVTEKQSEEIDKLRMMLVALYAGIALLQFVIPLFKDYLINGP